MTRTSKLIAGGALAGVLIALLVVPALINGNRYRSSITGAVEQSLGRKLAIDGPLSVALLPVPHLSAKAVRLANIDGASSPDMARLDGLDMRLRLLPLLAGRVEVSSLTLIGPQIQLERLADGRVNWDFHPAPKPVTAASSISAGVSTLPSVPDGGFRLEKVLIENGVVLVHQPGRAPLRFDGIDGAIALDSAQGPFRLSGTALFQDIELAADAQLGKMDGKQPLPVTLSLKLGRGAGDIRVSGSVDAAQSAFKGKLTAKAANLPKLAAAVGISDVALPAGPLAVEASLVGSGRDITADPLTVDLAGSQGSGNASVGLEGIPQVDMTLAFTRLDLDAWRASATKAEARPQPPAAVAASAPIADPVSAPPVASASVPAASSTTVATAPAPAAVPIPAPPPSNFVLPKRVSANLDLSVQAVNLHGGILRQARLNAALSNGEIVLNQASVTLPGDSELNLFGVVGAEAGQPSFDGSFEAGTDDLRGLLDWFAIDVAAVPPDRLHSARLVGKIAATQGVVKIDGTQLRLDGARIDAAADLRLGQRPALGVSFSADTLNLDAYWPSKSQAAPANAPALAVAASPPQPASAAESAPAPAVTAVSALAPASAVASILPAKSTTPSWIQRMDANVKGKVGQLVLHGATAQEVAVDATWLNGALSLRDLSSNDVAGAQVKLSGGLASGPLRLQDLHYDLHSAQPSRLLRLAGIAPSVDMDKFGALSLSGSLTGGVDLLTIDTHSEMAGTSLNVTGKVENLLSAPTVDIGIEASHSSLTQFLRLFVPDYHPTGALGAFAASTRLRGDRAVLQLTDLRLKAGPASVAGDVRLSLQGKPRIDASLSAGEVTIDPFLPGKRSADARPLLRDMIETGLLIPTNGVPMRRPILASTGPEPSAPTA
ncbi:MAG TPA: AsmA family protein, partial [Patescibacteria group bacterium]|nr:AsmA family protein [Patescibacteria group bacterium]